jgi:Icc-related predicted phosphoesterase
VSKYLSRFLCLFFALFLSSSLLYAQQENTAPSCRLVFISDTQAPMWVETLKLKRNRNEEATRMLLEDVLAQKPSALYFTGDVVNMGYKNDRWTLIDSSLNKTCAAGISTHACLGNHDVMRNAKAGEKNFLKRFPDNVNTGYVVKQDSVATVFLNSNFTKLSAEQNAKQEAWYKQTLSALDTAGDVKVIIVCCHHSPYTDSKIVHCSVPVQEKFVPPFIKSKKCRLFVSGHAHMFEHYNVQGKDFMVIGGGGGLNQPLEPGLCGQVDLAKDYKPMFHYLSVYLYADHLKVTSRKLKKDFSGIEEGLTFDVPVAQ